MIIKHPAVTRLLIVIASILTSMFLCYETGSLGFYPGTGYRFAWAMMRKDAATARSLSRKDLWRQIDSWTVGRAPFLGCPFTWDFDSIQEHAGSSVNGGTEEYSYYYSCHEKQYVFGIDMTLQRVNLIWKVVNFDVCEGWQDCFPVE